MEIDEIVIKLTFVVLKVLSSKMLEFMLLRIEKWGENVEHMFHDENALSLFLWFSLSCRYGGYLWWQYSNSWSLWDLLCKLQSIWSFFGICLSHGYVVALCCSMDLNTFKIFAILSRHHILLIEKNNGSFISRRREVKVLCCIHTFVR